MATATSGSAAAATTSTTAAAAAAGAADANGSGTYGGGPSLRCRRSLGRDIIIINAAATKSLARTTSLCGATDHGSSASVDATDASVHDAISRFSRNDDTINDSDITGGCTDLTT